jgi:ABC-2 type transport system ATP-binding protein
MDQDPVLSPDNGTSPPAEPPRRPVIQIRQLRKEFAGIAAVDGLTLDVPEGEIFGFIGPNGAGKTTTIRILATLLEPTSGEALVDGCCVQNAVEEVRRAIGYMPDYFGVYEGITVEEFLDFFAASFRIPRTRRRRVVADVMELTDLAKLRDRLVSGLSKGMKQRLCLAKTLVHDPKVLILDEPASALDPRARIELRVLLKELRGMGKTIFISSHILTELADLCTSVGIIEKGKLLYRGGIDAAREHASTGTPMVIRLFREDPAAQEVLRGHPSVGSVAVRGTEISFEYRGDPGDFHEVVKLLCDRRVPILTIGEAPRSLEKLFLEVTEGNVQ